MKPANRTEFHPQDGRSGLVFDWHMKESRWLGKFGILAIAGLVFSAPLVLIRITLDKLPVQEATSAVAILLTPDGDTMGWLDNARADGPFPTRFEPSEWLVAREMVDQTLNAVRRDRSAVHAPQFLELPSPTGIPHLPLVTKGERILPRISSPKYGPVETSTIRTMPVLYPLSVGMDELPVIRPRFHAEVTTEMDAELWRFLLQVAPNGVVRHAVALAGHNTPGREALAGWLLEHRFPASGEMRDRWIAVAVTFENQLIDGADDP